MGAFCTVGNLPVLGLGPRALHGPSTYMCYYRVSTLTGGCGRVSCAVPWKAAESGKD